MSNAISLPALMMACIGLVITGLLWLSLNYLWSFSFAYFTIFAFTFVYSRKIRTFDIFRPIIGLGILLFLYSISTLLFVDRVGLTYYGEQVHHTDLDIFRICCLLTILGLVSGTLAGVPFGSSKVPTLGHRTKSQASTFVTVAILFTVAAAPFNFSKFLPWMATSYGEVALSSRVARINDQVAGIREILLETVPMTLLLCALIITAFDQRCRLPKRILAVALFGLYLITTILSGWRSQMMTAILICVIYYNYRIRSIQLIQALIGGIIVYLLINLLSVARVSSNPIMMYTALTEQIEDRGFDFLALYHSGELATSTNLLRLIEGIRVGETNYQWGSLAFRQIAAIVPRFIWPDRPEFASELFVIVFYPGVLESGGGYGFFFPQDGYWDFGLIGVLIYAMVFGFFIEILYQYCRQRFESVIFLFLYALLYSQLVLSVIRSGMVGSIKSAIIATTPIVIFWTLSKLWRINR